ncbi:MAG: acetolactate decarboxylase [archaeon]|nr:acetolactate decarboxylase [archaeon]
MSLRKDLSKNSRYLFVAILLVAILGIAIFGSSFLNVNLQENGDILFQTSTMNALFKGEYDGFATYKELKKHGDFGLGTFDALDGEMIGLDGKFYQIKVDGIAYSVDDLMETPFAQVTFFEIDKVVLLNDSLNYTQLKHYLNDLLPTENMIYAFKIEGSFDYIKTRSIPKQNKPYPPLVEVLKNQTIFEFHHISGTIVGFWFPEYMEGVSASGYHFHFITEDRISGGHLLECRLQNVSIEIDYTTEFHMVLPEPTSML